MQRSVVGNGILCLALLATAGCRRGGTDASAQIIRLESAALDRWGNGDPGGFLALYGADITYFDPFQDRRTDGIQAMRALVAPITGKIRIDRYEMQNPKVQQYGEVAVLTYNLVNYKRSAAGRETLLNRWNSTSVFRRVDGRWRSVHSHWSLTKPELKQPAGD